MTKYGWATDGNTIVSDFSDQIKDRIFAITGPSKGGIGAETAISLAHGSPSQILLLGRSLTKIQPTIDEIHAINPSITTKFISVDLSSLTSVRAAANSILQDPTTPHIDVLINNAAIMASPYALTTDGIESQFATNHLSHFLLTNLLLPKILASIPPSSDPSSKTTAPKPRIINLSSTGHIFSDIQYDDPNFQNGLTYTPWKGYGQAKTANILMAVELNSRLQVHHSSKGIRVFAAHPGSIATGLQEHMMGDPEVIKEVYEKWQRLGRELPERKTLSQGCSTTLWGALDPGLEGVEGVYLRDCGVGKEGDGEENVSGWAIDAANAGRLWEVSERLVGEKFDI